jgi:DNA-3-methyladenine glycosylase
MVVTIKRVYEQAAGGDGFRVLVDRLWPRGVSKDRAEVALWAKDVAPSPDLRKWWDHDPARMDEFAARYRAELDANAAVADFAAVIGQHPVVTLVYGARDSRVNHAVVLRDYLLAKGSK